MYILWNNEKNEKLKQDRNICFEDVVYHIVNGDVLEATEHPNQKKYPGQKMLGVKVDDYAYLVPYVETEDGIFLKTIIPSRKATKRYLKTGGGKS